VVSGTFRGLGKRTSYGALRFARSKDTAMIRCRAGDNTPAALCMRNFALSQCPAKLPPLLFGQSAGRN